MRPLAKEAASNARLTPQNQRLHFRRTRQAGSSVQYSGHTLHLDAQNGLATEEPVFRSAPQACGRRPLVPAAALCRRASGVAQRGRRALAAFEDKPVSLQLSNLLQARVYPSDSQPEPRRRTTPSLVPLGSSRLGCRGGGAQERGSPRMWPPGRGSLQGGVVTCTQPAGGPSPGHSARAWRTVTQHHRHLRGEP